MNSPSSPARQDSGHALQKTLSPAADTSIRLNKALANAGICSRRKADELILQGRVTINGEVAADLGIRIRPGRDIIAVDGKPVAGAEERIYLMMHKPVRTVCTVRDPEGRTTVMDMLPEQWQKFRLYPVGRLDFFSEGLLLLTNDGEFAQRLAHPRHHLPKVYHVRLREKASQAQLDSMRRGMTLQEGDVLAPVEVEFLPWQGEGCLLQMTLHQGLNRQIRRMCRDLRLTVLRLMRVAQGPLRLGDLRRGTVRELSPQEVRMLREAACPDLVPPVRADVKKRATTGGKMPPRQKKEYRARAANTAPKVR